MLRNRSSAPQRDIDTTARVPVVNVKSALLLAAACLLGAFAPQALACPTCGIGDRFAGWGIVVYGAFMATPFALGYGFYRYVKKLDRLG